MKQHGFTLLELMITVTIAGIVVTIGVPYFRETIRQNRLTAYTNQFVSSLSLARSEAIKRGRRVVVCPSTDGAACAASGDYEQGWIVFADANPANNATGDAGDVVIRVFEKMPAGMTSIGSTEVQSLVFYTPDGLAQKSDGTPVGNSAKWTVCKDGKAREITITTIGRVGVISEPTSFTCP